MSPAVKNLHDIVASIAAVPAKVAAATTFGGRTRADALALIWRHTHRDYRGTIDGHRTVLTLRLGGTCLVDLDSLTDAEIVVKLKSADYFEGVRQAKLAGAKRAGA